MSSLEDLLVEDGFTGRRMTSRPRDSCGYKTLSMPTDLYRKQTFETQHLRIRTERTTSNISRSGSSAGMQKNERIYRRSKSNVREIERLAVESKHDAQEIESVGEADSYSANEDGKSKLRLISRYKVRNNTEFQQTLKLDAGDWDEVPKKKSFSNSHSGELLESETLKDKYDLQENERYIALDLPEDRGYRIESAKNLCKKVSLTNSSRNKRSQSSKLASDSQSQRQQNLKRTTSEPALDEIAIQAVISILCGYVRRFFKDENFRTSVHHSCMSCLGFTDPKELNDSEDGAIDSFRRAIEAIERVVGELRNPKELKKASLQLSVIAGLNSKDLKDGFTSGIPNSHLAACAHLYLSVIYKLQKKDKVSAKHLLQVFCDAPSQARAILLPELWDQLFLPHLSHLRMWYDQEASAIPVTSSRLRKMKLLDKVYNEILDTGTYQFAVYYKNWLVAGIEAPAVPSIHVPTTSVSGISQAGSHGPSPEMEPSPIGSVLSQPIIGERLYEAVFGHSNKLDGSNDVNNGDTNGKIFDGAIEDDGVNASFHEPATSKGQDKQEEPCKDSRCTPLPEKEQLLLTTENSWKSSQMSIEEVKELKDDGCQNTSENTVMLQLVSHANELTLKKLATSVFLPQETEDSIADASPVHSKLMTASDSCNKQSYMRSCVKCELKTNLLEPALNIDLPVTSFSAGQFANYKYFEESPFFSCTPKDFFCPLTGQLFEDPVTLETGHTFERVAIKEWFDRGNTTCPVTGKTLQCTAVPFTNFILKRLIDVWKSERCRNLLAFAIQMAGSSFNYEFRSKDDAAIMILEQLITGFNTKERVENAKHLISLGGLQFLVWKFETGNLVEKTRIAALLSCCIFADGGCRNYIARNIRKPSFIELLHSKQATSRTNAVLLLIELVCLNRRTEVTSFLGGLQNEGIMNTLHVLLVYLQTSPLEQRPLIAILLLHFDIMAEPRKYSIYREEAVDAITVALERSMMDEHVREQTCRALLILGGHFSYSGKIKTETWLLEQAGFFHGSEANLFSRDGDNVVLWEQEDKANEEWQRNLTMLLLGNGKKSFLECISKCLGSGCSNLVRACLTTVAWMSHTIASMTDAEFQLSAFSFLVPPLKENLENKEIECRVLASLSLLNFSKISECQVLLIPFAEEMMAPLQSLAVFTWTAEQLCSILSSDTL